MYAHRAHRTRAAQPEPEQARDAFGGVTALPGEGERTRLGAAAQRSACDHRIAGAEQIDPQRHRVRTRGRIGREETTDADPDLGMALAAFVDDLGTDQRLVGVMRVGAVEAGKGEIGDEFEVAAVGADRAEHA